MGHIEIRNRLVPDPMMTGSLLPRGAMTGKCCAVDGCANMAVRKMLCTKHHWRLQQYGDPLRTKTAADGEIPAWVLGHATWPDKDACLLWPFAISKKSGYPIAGKRKGHVVMCEAAHGDAPHGKPQVAHSCDNRSCVNPHHIRWATHRENMDDMVIRNRARHGEKHSRAKLTEEAVRVIRSTPRGYGVTKRLCQQFGVTEATLSAARSGRTWRTVR